MKCILLLALALVTVSASSGEVYKWTDKHGKVHYGDRPRANAAQVPIKARPAPDPNAERRRLKQRRLLDAFDKQRAEASEADAKRRAEKEDRERKCAKLREQLRQTRIAQYIYRDEGGQRRILTHEERAAYERDMAKLDAKHCREPR
ncbi:MAG: DUF4124 domain-containing protein [Gammaproteobacteria bacterium]|nr:DUF4124 domain-containing protein [Gammaproteobacteria bacterium]